MKLYVGSDAAKKSPVVENPNIMLIGVDEELMPTTSRAMKKYAGVRGYRPEVTVLIFALQV